MSSINRKQNVGSDRAALLAKVIGMLERGAATSRDVTRLGAYRRLVIAVIEGGSRIRKAFPVASASHHEAGDMRTSAQKSAGPAVDRWENEGGAIKGSFSPVQSGASIIASSVHLEEMTSEECITFLSRMSFGHLACIDHDRPYVVPIHFVSHQGGIYSFSMTGAKIESMRLNPHVCLQVDEVKSTSSWTSIILHGLYQELGDNEQWHGERLHAWSLIQKHPNWWEPGGSTIHPHETGAAAAKPVFFSIQRESLTGRKAVQREDVVR